MRVETSQFNKLVSQDVSVHRNDLLLRYTATGIVFLPSDKENAVLGPSPKEFIIDIPFVDCQNRAGWKVHCLGNLDFVGFSIRDMCKHRQVAVVVQKQMKLNRSLGLSKPRPVKKGGAKLNNRGIQAKKLVLEPKPALAKVQLPTSAQELIKYLLVQLPWPVFVGIRQGRSFGGTLESKVFCFA